MTRGRGTDALPSYLSSPKIGAAMGVGWGEGGRERGGGIDLIF